ncbi:MAG: nucleotidyltransferase family protein [Acetobacteraceae bacterium]
MRALLLAGGLGTRLRPVTDSLPKCLVPIQGRPLLDYWFDLLLPAGFERILVNTSYLPEQVRAHVAASAWRDRVDLVHEDVLLGTGGTVLANRDWFGNGPFLVAHADNLTDFDAAALARAHAARPAGCAITMLAFRTDAPQLCGILELDGGGIVRAFHEKSPDPPGNLANAAVYVFEPEVVARIAALGKPVVDLSTEVIPGFIGRILAVEHHGYHRDIGNVASLALANREFVPGVAPQRGGLIGQARPPVSHDNMFRVS